jgi:hypothetical protein
MEGVRNIEGRELLVPGGDFRTQLVPKLIGDLEKDLHNARIELRSGAAQNLFARLIEAARLAVRPVAGDGVEGVGDGENAGADGNIGSALGVWIAATVVVLLMG